MYQTRLSANLAKFRFNINQINKVYCMKKIYTMALAMFFGIAITNAQKIVKENFESGSAPAGWTLDENWEIGDVSQVASQYYNPGEHTVFVTFNDDALGNGNVASGSITSDALDLTGITSAQLVFQGFFLNGDYGADETGKVYVSADGGDTWTEEFDMPGNADAWQDANVSLAAYADMTIQLRFTFDDGGGWNYGWSLDDMLVIDPLTNDVLLGGFNVERFIKSDATISVDVTNLGTEEVNSVDIVWSDGTSEYTETITDLSIATFATASVAIPTSFAGSGPAEYEISISEAAMPNGVMDMDMSDNTSEATAMVSTVTAEFPRRMVAEEATGTWCPWCPRGEVFMNQMAADFPDSFVGIAVHNGDPMVVGEHDSNLPTAAGGFPGYPSVLVDRLNYIDPSDLPNVLDARLAAVSPVGVSATANFVTDEAKIDLTVSTDFYTTVSDRQFSIAVIVVEDGVTGTGSDYAQANNYANNAFGEMGGFENLPNPVPADQMVYNHVSRALIGGWAGMASGIPATVNDAENYEATFSIDIDPAWNYENLKLAIIVTDLVSGDIHNAFELHPEGLFTGNEEPSAVVSSNLYPNPAQGNTSLTFSLEETRDVDVMIYNSIGQNVWQKSYGELAGNQNFSLDISSLATGAYTLVIQVGDNDFIAKQLNVVK